jgi:hypothetical protein
MLLIALAWALGRPRREVAFWTVVGVLALLLSLGGNTFLYSIFYLLAPGFGAVRHQERAFLVYALSAAVLSSYGALALVAPLKRAGRLVLGRIERGARMVLYVGLALTFVLTVGWLGSEHRDLFAGVLRHHVFGLVLLAVGLILLALRPRRCLRRPWGMALLSAWIAFNLFSINWRFNLQPPTTWFPATALTDAVGNQIAAAPEPVRIASGGLLPNGPGAAAVYAFQDTTGNTPLQLASFEAFEASVPEWRRWQLLNVHDVLSDRDLDGPGLALVFPSNPPGEGDKQTRIYAVSDPFPRAWVVHMVEVIPDLQAALRRVSEDSFDLRRAAVVDQDLRLALPGQPVDGSTARVTSFASGEITLAVDAAADGLLVLSEVSYPGWRANVDGNPTPLLTADGLLRGIPVLAGRHQVRVWYAPLSVQLGLAISGLTIMGSIIASAVVMLKRRRSAGAS